MNSSKNHKRFIILFGLITIILVSNLFSVSYLSLQKSNNNSKRDQKYFPLTSASDMATMNIGFGDPQDVRVYMEEQSSTLNNNNGIFNISSPGQNSYLSNGDFLFKFQNNYTTDHILENNAAFNFTSDKYLKFMYRETGSSINTDTGILESGSIADLRDNNNGTYVEFTSDTNGVLNFTIKANYSETTTSYSGDTLEFLKEKILGFLTRITYNLNISANMTISIFNNVNFNWDVLLTKTELTSGLNSLTTRMINENLKYIDIEDCGFINFLIEREDNSEVNLRLNEFKYESVYAFELPINSQEQVALEFDIRGYNTKLNGFYTWIRTLNLTEAVNTELNISLYRASENLTNRGSDLTSEVNPAEFIQEYSLVLEGYSQDQLVYFDYSTDELLDIGNYFIVIKSNNSNNVYSLIVVNRESLYGDNEDEHQLKRTSDGGSAWTLAQIEVVPSKLTPRLDASSFKLNVTRAYFPEDFTINGNQTLRIQNIPLNNTRLSIYPYTDSYQWGVGTWKSEFPTHILSDTYSNFQIDLNWNTIITSDFNFNTSYYANSYYMGNSILKYFATYDEFPKWTLNYTLNLNDARLAVWNFTEFWFIYPDYFNNDTLITPDSGNQDVLSQTLGESSLSENPTFDKLIIPKSVVNNKSGSYLLNTTSYNAIDKMYSYINYKNRLWETQGFMYGDNMSIAVDVSGPESTLPVNGAVNVTLYYPNGTIFKTDFDLTGTISQDGNIRNFDFDDEILLKITDALDVNGKYYLGFFWNNGSSIGYKKIPVYIDYYDINFQDLDYLPDTDENRLQVSISHKPKDLKYKLLVASINKTTQFPDNFYSINSSNINQEFIYEQLGHQISLNLKTFLQNESILNPEENLKFKLTLENQDELFDVDVRISVSLVSLANENWIIANGSSATKKLSQAGNPSEDNIDDFEVELNIPEILPNGYWEGLNAPIRKGGAKAIVKIYIENEMVGEYEASNYGLLVNDTQEIFEGHIISLKNSDFSSSLGFLQSFERDECLYSPENTVLVANIYDREYISSYKQFNTSYQLNRDSEFRNLIINPQSPIKGQKFNFSSTLTTEFNTPIVNELVSCQYNNGSEWVNISSKLTDSYGNVSFQIDTNTLSLQYNNISLRLRWDGTTHILNNSEIVNINFVTLINQIGIKARIPDSVVYRNARTIMQVSLENQGSSIINISTINLIFSGINPTYTIYTQNSLLYMKLSPGETLQLSIAIDFGSIFFDSITFNVSVKAINSESALIFTSSKAVSATVLNYPLFETFMDLFILFILGVLIAIWAVAILYSLRLKKKIETPAEKREEKRQPRKGRYVKPSELAKKQTEDEAEAKREKTTDLDSLLEEEGLED